MADPTFSPLEYQRRHTEENCRGLKQRIDELSVSDYPASTPNQLIGFLQLFLDQLSLVLATVPSEDRLRMLGALIRELGVVLDWLGNAHTEQTPRGLAQLLKDLIEQLSPGTQVIARPQAAYNYSILNLDEILSKLVADYIPKSKQSLFDGFLSSPIKLISFPRIERDNLLAHAIFGHELGHPIATKFLMQEATDSAHAATRSSVQKKVNDLVERTVAGKNIDDAQKLILATRMFDEAIKLRTRALEELISDVVGTLIFGPSSFFAFYELLWTGTWDVMPTGPEYYPPSRMRIRKMLEVLKRTGFPAETDRMIADPSVGKYYFTAKQFFEQAEILAAADDDLKAIESLELVTISYDWMNDSLPGAIAYAESECTSVAFDMSPASENFKQLPELIKRVEMHLPPNEVGDPVAPVTVDYRAALLAAWYYKLRGLNSKGEPLTTKEIGRLQELSLRAVEYVILQKDYRNFVVTASASAS